LIIESVPIGKYPIAFRRDNDVLREEINIESGVTLGVQGDFRQGKVIIEKIETTIGTTEAKTLGAKDSKMCKDGAPMVLIPAGEFTMGTHYGNRDEKPVHKVYLDAFYMDKYEVTNEQYKKFIDSTKHRTPYYWKDLRYNEAHQPVVGVSWYDAVSYCEWAGKRLPTEAEWEKAARGGIDGKKYVWGDAWPPPNNSGNFVKFRGYKDVYTYSSPVGSFNPNGYGLYDMAGNVWELCSDWYSSHYYGDSSSRNPKGPDSGFVRVMRDRGWDDSSNSGVLRVSSRGHLDPAQNAYIDVGFRCAMDAMDVPK